MKLIVNQNIILQLRTEIDVATTFQLIEENRLFLRTWLPWVDFNKTEEDSLKHIKLTQQAFEKGEKVVLGIFYKNTLCGIIDFHAIDKTTQTANIGYWLAENYNGKGIMTASVKRLIQYGFKTLQLKTIILKTAIKNTKSAAIALRLGFQEIGIEKDGQWLYDHYVDLRVFQLICK